MSTPASLAGLLLALLWAAAALDGQVAFAQRGEIEIHVTEAETDQPLVVRMHVWNQRGRPQRHQRAPFWHDHFVFGGRIILNLPAGTYQFEMHRGPEYRIRRGYFTLQRGDADSQRVTMERFVDMKAEGWWSGDLDVRRPLRDMEMLMLAEDLHVASVVTWDNQRDEWEKAELPLLPVNRVGDNRLFCILGGADHRAGGELLYFNLPAPLPLKGLAAEHPSPLAVLRKARQYEGIHVDVSSPFWWDLPAFVASGMVDSLELIGRWLHRDGVADDEPGARPRDTVLYPGSHGSARYAQQIYFHLLNSGVRLPPSAGSGSGQAPNPVGYNRAYVYLDGELTWEKWWEGLRAGRVVVTNGPMLRPFCEGRPPGHVFRAPAGETLELEITANLATQDTVEYFEVIHNGRVVHEVRLADWAEAGGQLPPVAFQESGWLLVRAVTDRSDTYRYAMSGPWYVEIGERPRISRAAAQFFLDWVYERARRLEIDDPQQRAEALRFHQAARDFWQRRVAAATCD